MKALFLVAEMQEAKYVIEEYKMVCKTLKSFNLWADEDDEHLLLITGPGINNVIKSLSRMIYMNVLSPCVNVVNIGYAGAKGLNVGDVEEVKSCHCLEFPTKADVGLENRIKLSNEGVDCYTSFDFVEKAEGIEGKALFDMELAYIARFLCGCSTLRSVKIVSDNLDYESFKSFNEKEAWEKALIKVKEILKEGEENVSRNIAT